MTFRINNLISPQKNIKTLFIDEIVCSNTLSNRVILTSLRYSWLQIHNQDVHSNITHFSSVNQTDSFKVSCIKIFENTLGFLLHQFASYLIYNSCVCKNARNGQCLVELISEELPKNWSIGRMSCVTGS